MTESLELQLVKEFPTFFRDYKGDLKQTCMAWGLECGDGWFNLFYNLNKDINNYLQSLPEKDRPDFYWSQVKEKFGTGRFYCNGGDDKIDDLITEAENKSGDTCETCGERGITRGNGWLYTSCEKHSRESGSKF
jgi:hypothetical protein